jgi:hypothetical protein
MSISVTRKQLMTVISGIADIQKHDIRIPALIHGVHGIGKTEMVKQVATTLGYQCVCLYLSMQEPSDLLGLPHKTEGVDGKVYTAFSEPDWLHEAKDDPRPAIFFLDEINRAPLMVQQVMLPFTLSGTIHTHSIREHDIVVAAMNPDSLDYSVESMDDKALLSRFAHFYAEPTFNEWKEYCVSQEVHPSLLSSMDFISKHIDTVKVDSEDKIEATPDRRNLFKIGKIMNVLPPDDVRKLGPILFPAMVGTHISAHVLSQFRDGIHVTGEDIIKGNYDMSTIESRIDQINLINESLINEITNTEKNWFKFKMPVENGIFDSITTFKFTKGQIKNINKWIDNLTPDLKYSLVYKLKYKLVSENRPECDIALFIMSLFELLDSDIHIQAISYGSENKHGT